MQILHEMPSPIFWENKEKYSRVLFAEILTQHAKQQEEKMRKTEIQQTTVAVNQHRKKNLAFVQGLCINPIMHS